MIFYKKYYIIRVYSRKAVYSYCFIKEEYYLKDNKKIFNCGECEFRHDNGNCLPVGGFCTSVPAAYCPLIPRLKKKI